MELLSTLHQVVVVPVPVPAVVVVVLAWFLLLFSG